jgi:hypothetical protein
MLSLHIILHCPLYRCTCFVNRYRADDKKKLEANFETESQRGAEQVLSCSVVGCVIAAA